MKKIYAIDFGTSNSLLAIADEKGAYAPLPIDPKYKDPSIFKSLFYFHQSNEPVFGATAIEEYVANSFEGRFVRSIKKFLPDASFSGTQIGTQLYGIEALIGAFLGEMKRRADILVEDEIDTLVMGRPASYSLEPEKDRLAEDRMYRAARLAGFKDVQFLAEPVAAAYDIDEAFQKEQIILVIDLGAGTSDFSIVKMDGKKLQRKNVLAMNAISMAGDAFDGSIMDGKLAPYFGSDIQYQLPLSSNVLKMPSDIRFKLRSPAEISFMTKRDVQFFLKDMLSYKLSASDRHKLQSLLVLLEDNLAYHLYSHIEAAKVDICQKEKVHFSFDYPEIEIETDMSLPDFAKWSSKICTEILKTMDTCLEMAGVTYEQIDRVFLTGGSSQIPFLRAEFEKRFAKNSISNSSQFHSVIQGLTKYAQTLL
jgi:hypothetical chaperone protein